MAQTALQTLIEKLDEVKLLDGFNGHYHSGCNMAKEIIKSLATELLPKEREDIKDGIRIVAPMLVFMMPADAEQMAEDYFTQTFNGQTTASPVDPEHPKY